MESLYSFLQSAWGPLLWPVASFFFCVAIESWVRMHKFLDPEMDTETRRGHMFDMGVVGSRIGLLGIGIAATCCISAYLEAPTEIPLPAIAVAVLTAFCLPVIRHLELAADGEPHKRYWPRNRAGLLGFWIPLPWASLLLVLCVWMSVYA
jgi:hypothetical protein